MMFLRGKKNKMAALENMLDEVRRFLMEENRDFKIWYGEAVVRGK